MSLLKLTSIESVMPSNHLILCHPPFLSSIFPSIRVFSNRSLTCCVFKIKLINLIEGKKGEHLYVAILVLLWDWVGGK